MDTLVSKVMAMIILLSASLLIGSLPALLIGPLQLHSRRAVLSTSAILSVLSCFGGGVFLATCLLDLIPDVRKSVTIALNFSDIKTDFPVSDFIVAMGLFIILIIEQTALTYKHRNDVLPHSHGDDDEGKPLLHSAGENDHKHNYASISTSASNSGEHTEESRHTNHEVPHSTRNETINYVSFEQPSENMESHSTEHHPHHHDVNSTSSQGDHSHDGHSDKGANDGDDCHDLHSPSKLRSLLLLGALSLHSIFEGLALGIQGDSEAVWTLSVAVVIHKSILAFSLGVNILKTGMGKAAMFKSLLLFSLMAPIGTTIGILITAEFSERFTNSIANGFLQGLATGTFLYITFFEVLPHEMSFPKDRILKVLAIVIGFSVICGLILLFPS